MLINIYKKQYLIVKKMMKKNTIKLAQITIMAFQKFNNTDFLTYDVQVKGQIFLA